MAIVTLGIDLAKNVPCVARAIRSAVAERIFGGRAGVNGRGVEQRDIRVLLRDQ